MRWLLAFALVVLLAAPAAADDVFDPLLEQLLRLPDHDSRRATIIDKLGELGDDLLSRERLGSALSVLGALHADDRTSDYVVRLFLSAALDPDPSRRDDAVMRARRGLGPPAGDERPKTDAAARAMLDTRWLTLRDDPPSVRRDGERLMVSEFVALTRDSEIWAVMQREEARSWGVFGGVAGGGLLSAIGGVLIVSASRSAGLDGAGRGRLPDTPGVRAVGGALIGIGAAAITVGAVQKGVVTWRHVRSYGRYYGRERLRELVDRQNAKEADALGIDPEAD